MSQRNPFKILENQSRKHKISSDVFIRYPLSLRQVEDTLHERGIDVCDRTVRYRWSKFSPIFSNKIKQKANYLASNRRWYIGEVFVKIHQIFGRVLV